MTNTRRKTEIFGVGEAVTDEDAIITGCRLPTGLQLLRSLLYHMQEDPSQQKTKFTVAKIVYNLAVPFYQKGGIPMLAELSCCQKLVKLLEDNEKLRRIPKARRESAGVLAKIEENKKDLAKTFPLWTKDADSKIVNTEDLEFLISMKTDRKASIAGFDKISYAFHKRKEEREQKKEGRKRKNDESLQNQFQFSSSASLEPEDDPQPGPSFIAPTEPPPLSHKRVKKVGTEAFIPHDIMKSPKLVSLATRMKMTPAQQSAFTKAIIEESGGDISKEGFHKI